MKKVSVGLLALLLVPAAYPQGRGGRGGGAGRGGAAPTPKATAAIDMTGYWVSVVTEDWRWRMVTPPKGDYSSVPLNAEGRQVADAWDPAKDPADGTAINSTDAAPDDYKTDPTGNAGARIACGMIEK